MFDFETNYKQWKETKLAQQAANNRLKLIKIDNPNELSGPELTALRQQCDHHNFALYRLNRPEDGHKSAISAMLKQLGMLQLDKNLCADNDSISSLQVMHLGRARGYIPYTENALNWHTDGYYNPLHEHIRSFLLHCAQNAQTGGENMFINHELIYIRLYDEDPALINALRQSDALTIPANIENSVEVRSAQTGPVFYRDEITNTLQMRYTARSRSIQWKQDKKLQKAVSMIETILSDSDYIQRYTLQPGEGFICNNILHGRSAFTNGNIPREQRLMYRARSYNRLFS